MTNRKKYHSMYQDEPVDTQNIQVLETKTKHCKVFNIIGNKLFLYFESYGIQVEVSDTNAFKVGDLVSISYSGEIGEPNFKKWLTV